MEPNNNLDFLSFNFFNSSRDVAKAVKGYTPSKREKILGALGVNMNPILDKKKERM